MYPIDIPDDDIAICTDQGMFAIGDYSLRHIRSLLAEYDGDLEQVVERLEEDGWSPLNIIEGAAR